MGPSILLALLLGAIGLVRGQGNGFGTSVRPDYPADPVKGFKPGAERTSTKGGHSDWSPFWNKDSGKLPWVDKEWEDWSSCLSDSLHEYWSITWDSDENIFKRILAGSCLSFIAALYGNLLCSFVLMIRNDLEHRWCVSPRCLLFVAALALPGGITGSIICINSWGLMNFMKFAYQFPILGYLNYNIGVSIVERYQVKMKMNKGSSRNIKILIWFLRAWGLFMVFIAPTLSISSGFTGLYISFLAPLVVNIGMIVTFRHLITNSVLHDKKDDVEGHNTIGGTKGQSDYSAKLHDHERLKKYGFVCRETR